MSAHCCMYCLGTLKKYNLDFTRDIVCGTCVQKLLGTKNIPRKYAQKRSQRPRKSQTIGSVGNAVGKKLPTGVR